MSDSSDDLGFKPANTSKEQDSSDDNLGFTPHKSSDLTSDVLRQASFAETSPIIQKLKSFGYGVAEGIPFSEQAAGLIGKLKGQDYSKARDVFKSNAELNQYQNPSEYLLGNLAGGAGTAIVPELAAAGKLGAVASKIPGISTYSKLGEPAKQAVLGASYGASKSNVDLTKGSDLTSEDLVQYAKDIAVPAVVAGGIGLAPKVLAGTVTHTPLGNTSYGKIFNKSYNEGVDLTDKKVLNKLVETKMSLADEISNKILSDAKENAMTKTNLIKEHGQTPINLGEVRKFADDALANLPTDLKENKELVAEIQDKLNQAFKDTEKTVTKKTVGSELTKEVPATPSMRDKLNEKIADAKLKDQELGVNARYEITPIENELGQKRLKVTRMVDEAPAAQTERVVPVKDETGKVIDQRLERNDLPTIETTPGPVGIHPDIEGIPAHKVFSPTVSEEQMIEVMKHPDQYTLEEVNQVRKNIADLLNKNKVKVTPMGDVKNIVHSPLERTLGKVSGAINESEPIAKINSQIQKRAELAEALGMGKMSGEDLEDLALKDQFNATKPLREFANPTDASAEKAAEALKKQQLLSKKLGEYDPELAEKFNKMKGVSEDLSLAGTTDSDAGQLVYHSGRLRAALNQGAGKGGIMLRKLEQGQKYVSTPAVAAAKAPMFSEMSDEQKQDLIQRLKGKGIGGVAKKVEQAAQSNNPLEHAQADFVLKQTPGAKKVLNNNEEE